MNKDRIKNPALILLLGVTIFSMFSYVAELRARFSLQDSLTEAQGKIAELSQEKRNLLQELGKEKKLNQQLEVKNLTYGVYLKASKDRLSRLFRENQHTQNELEEINAKFTVLKAENRALIDSHQRNYLENEQLKFKLGSVVELKKQIRVLRSKKSKASQPDTKGNQGFMIKNGRSTLDKIKIEVVPNPHGSHAAGGH
ncbi:MAG: hypothetical protein COV73_00095 [Candidatus Omnitrophica bacterium CG11_big_fil_rev_8_21_14_0_20_43_6]|nr:MAG: hypothetical protein COV73_00095 [Candidatus Omnitrophica bacterium CG11_big_fil_rev_8_21_14_0_20_43_6]